MRALVIATWNVHGFVGRDGRFDPKRSARVLRNHGAEVVALQEAVTGPDGAALDALGAELGMAVIEGPTLRDQRGRYGNALLSALPVEHVDRIDLSVGDVEPRGALMVRVATGQGPLRVLATHLGLRRAERGRQVARLARRLAADPPEESALLGDWNDWTPGALQLGPLRRQVGAFTRVRSYPARRPALALDRIAVGPSLRLHDACAADGPEARVASDHLPVRARILFPDEVDR